MAFVSCENCGQEISDQASACPKCGTPTTASPAAGMVGPKGADLRPLAIGEIVDGAIKLYRDHALTLLKLVALVVVPVQVVSALIGWSIAPDETPSVIELNGTTSVDGAEIATLAAGGIVVAVLGLVGMQLATGASLKAVSDAYLGREPRWGESLEFALGKLGSLIWIQLLAILGVFVPPVLLLGVVGVLGAIAPPLFLLLILLVPAGLAYGFWIYVSWWVWVPALLIEDRRGRSALRRSFRLVRGRFWPVAGVFALAWVITAVVQSVIGVVFGLIPGLVTGGFFATGMEGGASVTSLVSNIVTNSLAQTLVTPFAAAVVAIVYFDLRVRKEGFDLDLLAQGVGAGPPTPGGGIPVEEPDDPPSASPAEEAPGRPPPSPPDPGWSPDPSGEAWESHDRPRRRSDEE